MKRSREELDPEQRKVLEDLLRQYVRGTEACEATGLSEDDLVEAQWDLLEAGLIEIIVVEDEDGEPAGLTILPTEKALRRVHPLGVQR
jgi:hypothetical protein